MSRMDIIRTSGTSLAVGLLALLLAFPMSAWASKEVEGVRIWPAPDHTRLVLDTAGKVEHNVFSLSGPSRLVIDMKQPASRFFEAGSDRQPYPENSQCTAKWQRPEGGAGPQE